MNLKLALLLAGAMTLIITSVPMVADAQANSLTQTFPALAGINLTSQQQNQINQLRQSTRSQVESILTPPQRDQLKTAIDQGNTLRDAIAEISLSLGQKRQLRDVFQSVQQQMATILTPEQQQQLRQNVQTIQSRQTP